MYKFELKDYCAMLIEEGYKCYEQYLYKQDNDVLRVFDVFEEEEYQIPLYSLVKSYFGNLEEYDL